MDCGLDGLLENLGGRFGVTGFDREDDQVGLKVPDEIGRELFLFFFSGELAGVGDDAEWVELLETLEQLLGAGSPGEGFGIDDGVPDVEEDVHQERFLGWGWTPAGRFLTLLA